MAADTDDEVRVRRNAVERAMEDFVRIADDRLRVKLNAALLAEAKEIRFDDGPEYDLRTWAIDIGKLITRMNLHCGPCHPPGVVTTCSHAAELIEAARLNLIVKFGRQGVRVYDKQLGSETTRRRMVGRDAATAKTRRSESRREVDEAIQRRKSIVHRGSYSDACEMFWNAARWDRSYLLRLDRL